MALPTAAQRDALEHRFNQQHYIQSQADRHCQPQQKHNIKQILPISAQTKCQHIFFSIFFSPYKNEIELNLIV